MGVWRRDQAGHEQLLRGIAAAEQWLSQGVPRATERREPRAALKAWATEHG
jgi:hypothetical protein